MGDSILLDSIVKFLHLLATAIWIGGAVFIPLVLQPSLRLIDPQQSGKLYGIVAKRFSITGWICILVLLLTGYLKTPERMFFDFSYGLGFILAAKHVLVILAIIVGLVIALHVIPGMRKHTPRAGEAPSADFLRCQKRLSTLATVNLLLGLLVLVCAALLW
jgi:putative copper resistance protein D